MVRRGVRPVGCPGDAGMNERIDGGVGREDGLDDWCGLWGLGYLLGCNTVQYVRCDEDDDRNRLSIVQEQKERDQRVLLVLWGDKCRTTYRFDDC